MNILLDVFHLNGHNPRFHPQMVNLELPLKSKLPLCREMLFVSRETRFVSLETGLVSLETVLVSLERTGDIAFW